MSVTASCTSYLVFSDDQESELVYASGPLEDSPYAQEVVTLDIGDNSISVPDVDGFTVHGVVIVPPTANDVEMTLKGNAADIGILLSANFASVIHFGTPPATIGLSVAEEVVGVRLVWF
jgi:hypothetical protein